MDFFFASVAAFSFIAGAFLGAWSLWMIENRAEKRFWDQKRAENEEKSKVSRKERESNVLDFLKEGMPGFSGPPDDEKAGVGSDHPAGPPPPTPDRVRKDPMAWRKR